MPIPTRRALATVLAASTLAALAAGAPALATGTGGAEWRGPRTPDALACGQVVTTDVRLATDLVDCPGPGLVVGADGVTIDLNGHTIDGDGRFQGSDAGIDNGVRHTDVTIKNGTIKEFDAGVKVGALPSTPPSTSTRNTLRRLTVTDTNEAIWLIRSDDNDVLRNRVDGVIGGTGIDLLGSSGNDVERNTVLRTGTAIELTDADDNRISRNGATGNAVGVAVTVDSTGADVERNLLVSNNQTGIFLGGAHDTTVERNLIASNLEDGIDVAASSGTDVIRNVVLRNGDKPIFRDGDGILVDENSTATWLSRNRVEQNHDDGIDVRTTDTGLQRNSANANGDLGVSAVDGVDDAGGNRAVGNGNPAQCTGIACAQPAP
jgi:parallel beta-helix repeat protein